MPSILEDILVAIAREIARRNDPSPPMNPPGRRDRGVRIIPLRANDLNRRQQPRRWQWLNIVLASRTVEEAIRRDPSIPPGFFNWAAARGYIRLAPGPARSGGRGR